MIFPHNLPAFTNSFMGNLIAVNYSFYWDNYYMFTINDERQVHSIVIYM